MSEYPDREYPDREYPDREYTIRMRTSLGEYTSADKALVGTIMVIDDDQGVAQLCRRVLERGGYEVISVTNPRQGVALLQQTVVDLLLVDIRMPGLDGFQVMEQARKLRPEIAVVVMTGFGTLETAIQALRLGADGLLLKPFEETSELVETVTQALRESERRREATRLQTIRPLIQITEALFAETNPKLLLDKILDTMAEALRCNHAGMYTLSQDGDRLELTGQRGTPLPGELVGPDHGPISRADAWNAPVWVRPEVSDFPDLAARMEACEMGSLMCAPAMRGRQRRSVLLAGRSPKAPTFTEADNEMFVVLARQAGAALENAILYDELRQATNSLRDSQRALIQAEKMAAIGRLTASIAHEVNNPLQAMGNCLHLVSRTDLPQEKRDHYLGAAQTELDRLMKTVGQMLDFYRPSKLTRELAEVTQLVEGVLILFAKSLEKQQIRISRDYAPDLPLVFVVSNQIQQVFFNIILNAMEAMPDGGEVMIQVREEDGGPRTGDRGRGTEDGGPRTVLVTFRDTGPGIAPDEREKIFEPFNSTKEQGTGLGLSISYNILEAHGGKLEILELPGPGACFRVTLPAAR